MFALGSVLRSASASLVSMNTAPSSHLLLKRNSLSMLHSVNSNTLSSQTSVVTMLMATPKVALRNQQQQQVSQFMMSSINSKSNPSSVMEPSALLTVEDIIQAMNRNARKPRRANRGKRPVCNANRRAKRDRRTKGW